jgi:PIN domain nuclease of toxin-antitoxin system
MKLLLDTHIFLWYIGGDNNLSAERQAIIRDPNNEVFVSVVSFWEIAIKNQLGKLPLPDAPEIFLPTQRQLHQMQSLPLNEESIWELSALPAIHRDPFDRILICQAIHHELILMTDDSNILSYSVKVL